MAEKKFKVVFKPKADRRILAIMMYIAEQGNPERAVTFSNELYEFGYSLATVPFGYPVCRHPQLAKRKMRCATFRKTYIFIYKPIRHTIVIYNIIHGSKNPIRFSA